MKNQFIDFLTAQDVIQIHAEQLAIFGGGDGVRDRGLLESAVSQPSATFDYQYMHVGLHMMAAAYLFHLSSNHPFVDGNKRVALLAALNFLSLNGAVLPPDSDALYELAIQVAKGEVDKVEVATVLEHLARQEPYPLEEQDSP